jgi:epsin
MDRLESLSSTLQNITLYDIKSMYNQVLSSYLLLPRYLLTILTHQAKNVVLNISEMEAKVREATNDDPWCVKLPCYEESRLKSFCRGASSTLMQEIAQGYVSSL